MSEQLLVEILAVLRRLDARVAALMETDGVEMGGKCGACGSTDVVEDRAFGQRLRLICRGCAGVTELEAVNG